jgi:hypothetical protein
MANLVKALAAGSALAFILAVIANFGVESVTFTSAEGYSRASANLALLAIVILMSSRGDRAA